MSKHSFDELVKIKAKFDKEHNINQALLTYIAPENIDDYGKFIRLYRHKIGLTNLVPLVDNSFAQTFIKDKSDVQLYYEVSGGFRFTHGVYLNKSLEKYIQENGIDFSFKDCLS